MNLEKCQILLGNLSSHRAVKALELNHYHLSYRALQNLARQAKDDPENDGLLSLSCAIYSWMPTILKNWDFQKFNVENPIEIIKNLSSVESAKAFLLNIDATSPVNKSWVGLSKLLHFLNPKLFPIWDSRIAKHFELNWSQQFNKKDIYISYFIFIHKNLGKQRNTLDLVANRIETRYAYRPSDVRCLESLLFSKSNEKQ